MFNVHLKFIYLYSEKATKFCEIFILLFSYVVPVKSKVKISQNFVAFSEYMNFNFHQFNVMKLTIQRIPALRGFWDLKKTVLREIGISGTVGGSITNAKIPHLRIHKPKTAVVGSAVVKTA